jgi:hypothetical protein
MRWPVLAAACVLAAIPAPTAGLQQVLEKKADHKVKVLGKKSHHASKKKALEKKGHHKEKKSHHASKEKKAHHKEKKSHHKATGAASHRAAGAAASSRAGAAHRAADQAGAQKARPAIAVQRTAAEFEEAVHEADKMLQAMEIARKANLTEASVAAQEAEEASKETQVRRAVTSDAAVDTAVQKEASDTSEIAKASDQAEAGEASDKAEGAEATDEAKTEESSDAVEAAKESGEASGKAAVAEATDEARTQESSNVAETAKASDKAEVDEAGTAESSDLGDIAAAAKAFDQGTAGKASNKADVAEGTDEAGTEESSDVAETAETSGNAEAGEASNKADDAEATDEASTEESSNAAEAAKASSKVEADEASDKADVAETTDEAGTEESSDTAETAKASDQAEAGEASDKAEGAEPDGEAGREGTSVAAGCAKACGQAEEDEASNKADVAETTDEAGTEESSDAAEIAKASDQAEASEASDKAEGAGATDEASTEESSDAAETAKTSGKAEEDEASDKADVAETTDEAGITGKTNEELSEKAVLLFERGADDSEGNHDKKGREENEENNAHGAAIKAHKSDYNYQPKDFQLAGSKSGYLNFIKKYPCTRSPGPDGFPNKFDWIIHRQKDLDDLDGEKEPYAVFSSMEIHTVPAILDFIEQNWPDSEKKRVAYFTGDMMLSRVDKNFGAGTEERLRKAFAGGIWWQAYDVRKPGFKVAPDGLNGMYLMPVWDVAQKAINAATLEGKTKGVLAAWGKFHPNLDANIPARRKLHEWVGTKGSIAAGVEHASFEPREYWPELAKYRFTLSPRGGGIQSPKNDEALLVLTIPISTREGSIRGFKSEPAFDDLKKLGWPMVVLDEWSEITQPKLNQWWEELSPRLLSFRKNCLTTEGFWRIITGQVTYCE